MRGTRVSLTCTRSRSRLSSHFIDGQTESERGRWGGAGAQPLPGGPGHSAMFPHGPHGQDGSGWQGDRASCDHAGPGAWRSCISAASPAPPSLYPLLHPPPPLGSPQGSQNPALTPSGAQGEGTCPGPQTQATPNLMGPPEFSDAHTCLKQSWRPEMAGGQSVSWGWPCTLGRPDSILLPPHLSSHLPGGLPGGGSPVQTAGRSPRHKVLCPQEVLLMGHGLWSLGCTGPGRDPGPLQVVDKSNASRSLRLTALQRYYYNPIFLLFRQS